MSTQGVIIATSIAILLSLGLSYILYKSYREGVPLFACIIFWLVLNAGIIVAFQSAIDMPRRDKEREDFLRRNHACIKKLVGGGADRWDAEVVCEREEKYKKEKETK